MAWEQCTKPKEFAGLGIKNLEVMNHALLSKCLIRFSKERNTLWAQVISLKTEFWLLEIPCGSSCWITITKAAALCYKNLEFSVGDWSGFSFWHDPWTGDSPLAERVPSLFKLSVNKDGVIQHFLAVDNNL